MYWCGQCLPFAVDKNNILWINWAGKHFVLSESPFKTLTSLVSNQLLMGFPTCRMCCWSLEDFMQRILINVTKSILHWDWAEGSENGDLWGSADTPLPRRDTNLSQVYYEYSLYFLYLRLKVPITLYSSSDWM